jgi:3-hydroxybutyryl-CoA dehydratase
LKVDPERMKELADVLDDPNPIHVDPAVVRALGMGDRVINQGPANCSYVVNMLRREYPGGTITRISFRLLANVYAGDTVIAGSRVEARDETEAHCTIWLDADGRRAVEGTATVVL